MKRRILNLFLFVLIQFANGQSVTYYVSPKGSAQSTGISESTPLASVQKALSNWAGLKATGKAFTEAIILLEGETCQLAEPILITQEN